MHTKVRRRPATLAESQQALASVKALFQRTPIEVARDAVIAAKVEVSASCGAILRDEPGAAQRADVATARLEQARAELAALDAEAA